MKIIVRIFAMVIIGLNLTLYLYDITNFWGYMIIAILGWFIYDYNMDYFKD